MEEHCGQHYDPQLLRALVVWKTHRMQYAGSTRTLRRIRLDWHWPGMTLEVRLIRIREVRQSAKHSWYALAGVVCRLLYSH